MNAYLIAFVAACVTYVIMVSSLKKDDSEKANMEAIMYSVGAGAIGFAVVHFLTLQSIMPEPVVPKPVAAKPTNAAVGLTGETIMTDSFPTK